MTWLKQLSVDKSLQSMEVRHFELKGQTDLLETLRFNYSISVWTLNVIAWLSYQDAAPAAEFK